MATPSRVKFDNLNDIGLAFFNKVISSAINDMQQYQVRTDEQKSASDMKSPNQVVQDSKLELNRDYPRQPEQGKKSESNKELPSQPKPSSKSNLDQGSLDNPESDNNTFFSKEIRSFSQVLSDSLKDGHTRMNSSTPFQSIFSAVQDKDERPLGSTDDHQSSESSSSTVNNTEKKNLTFGEILSGATPFILEALLGKSFENEASESKALGTLDGRRAVPSRASESETLKTSSGRRAVPSRPSESEILRTLNGCRTPDILYVDESGINMCRSQLQDPITSSKPSEKPQSEPTIVPIQSSKSRCERSDDCKDGDKSNEIDKYEQKILLSKFSLALDKCLRYENELIKNNLGDKVQEIKLEILRHYKFE